MASALARRSLPLRSLPLRRSYGSYHSPHAPKYAPQLNVQGITLSAATKYAQIAGGLGVSLGVFAVYFFGEVPRVREDILGKLPVVGGYWDRSVPPEDNPF